MNRDGATLPCTFRRASATEPKVLVREGVRTYRRAGVG